MAGDGRKPKTIRVNRKCSTSLSALKGSKNHKNLSMPDIFISQSGIHQLLTTLDKHKASRPDRISPFILKYCADKVAPILYVIFNQSLSTSMLPNDWLKADISPVYKKVTTVMLLITDLYP